MKKIITLVILAFFVCSGITFAKGNQGCCSWHGGLSYCASNGRWVCKDGTYSPSCTCSTRTTTYTYPTYTTPTYTIPTYTTSTYTTPTYTYTPTYTTTSTTYTTPTYTTTYVNQYAYYDKQCQTKFGANAVASGTKYCVCKQGYMRSADRTSCISETESCKQQFGPYSIAGDPGYCVCQQGYIWDDLNKKTKCVSRKEYCSKYPNVEPRDISEYGACKCKDGYEWADLVNIELGCIPKDEYCQRQYGSGAIMNSEGICVCGSGYKWSSDGKLHCEKSKSEMLDKVTSSNVEALKSKEYLGEKAAMVESMVKGYKDKDAITQQKIKDVAETFKSSDDEYTKNVGIYLSYLLNQ